MKNLKLAIFVSLFCGFMVRIIYKIYWIFCKCVIKIYSVGYFKIPASISIIIFELIFKGLVAINYQWRNWINRSKGSHSTNANKFETNGSTNPKRRDCMEQRRSSSRDGSLIAKNDHYNTIPIRSVSYKRFWNNHTSFNNSWNVGKNGWISTNPLQETI